MPQSGSMNSISFRHGSKQHGMHARLFRPLNAAPEHNLARRALCLFAGGCAAVYQAAGYGRHQAVGADWGQDGDCDQHRVRMQVGRGATMQYWDHVMHPHRHLETQFCGAYGYANVQTSLGCTLMPSVMA
jgi:hypothetical protein